MTIALQMQLDELPTAILSVGGVCGQGPVLLEGYGGFGPVLVQKFLRRRLILSTLFCRIDSLSSEISGRQR